jgi:hypothetical protein
MGGATLLHVRCRQRAEDLSVTDYRSVGAQWFDARRCRRLPGTQAECAHVEGAHYFLANDGAIRQWALTVRAAIIGDKIFRANAKYRHRQSPRQLHSQTTVFRYVRGTTQACEMQGRLQAVRASARRT